MRFISILTLLTLSLLSLGSSAQQLSFMAVGDWGKVGSDQASVAEAMASVASGHPVNFIVSVGDNFYEDGVSGVDDPQWKSTFSDVFEVKDSLKNVPWFAVLGNHDYHQDPEAQIAYTNGKWNMPGHYYTQTFSIGSGQTAKFIFIDTIWFAPDLSHHTGVKHKKSVFKQQYNWLENQLKNSYASDWVFVIGHYPLFSNGENGDQSVMQAAMQHLLEKYHVDAYISGHDHCLQHLTNAGIQYFVSGNGALRGKISSSSSAETANFARVEPGFTFHSIEGNKLITKFVSAETGDIMYEFSQGRKAKGLNPAVANVVPAPPSSSNLAIVVSCVVMLALVVICGAIYLQTWKRREALRHKTRYPTEETPLVLII